LNISGQLTISLPKGSGTHVPHISDTSTKTRWDIESTDAGLNATFSGFGLELFAGNIPIGGTITGLSIDQGTTRIAEFSGITWDADPLFSAFGSAPTDEAPLNTFINAEPITIDARQATSTLNDFQDHFSFTTDLTIKGSRFGDRLVGGSGDDVILGKKGNDIIHSGSGDDLVRGGRGHDVFFNDVALDHRNIIQDFEDGIDLIRVTKNSGFDAIKITALNSGEDTLIELSGGTKIVLRDVASTSIDATDFDLV